MARSDTRYSIYPAPKAVEILGSSSPALNQAIECWAALLARATADNSRVFEEAEYYHIRQLTGREWQMNEWSLLAEALKDVRFDPEFANPGQLLATAVEDAHRLEYIGAKCLDWGSCDSSVIKDKDIDREVAKVVEKLGKLDYAHAWAVIVSVRWFWEHHAEIDPKKDNWWELAFRRQWHQKQTKDKHRLAAAEKPKKARRRTISKPTDQ